jgi:hypothetical protein
VWRELAQRLLLKVLAIVGRAYPWARLSGLLRALKPESTCDRVSVDLEGLPCLIRVLSKVKKINTITLLDEKLLLVPVPLPTSVGEFGHRAPNRPNPCANQPGLVKLRWLRLAQPAPDRVNAPSRLVASSDRAGQGPDRGRMVDQLNPHKLGRPLSRPISSNYPPPLRGSWTLSPPRVGSVCS